jgi:hypothetical protein
MDKPISTVAREIADAAVAFEEQQTGHAPKSVTVVLSGETLLPALFVIVCEPTTSWKGSRLPCPSW